MNVALTPELEALIRRKLDSGLYKNASEVVREGLRLLAAQDDWKTDVRKRIQQGLEDARAGRLVPAKKAIAGLRSELRARKRKG